MERIGLLGAVAGALAVVAIGVVAIGAVGLAQADDPDWGFGGPQVNYGYDFYYPRNGNPWMDQMVPSVKVPRVDTSVRN